LLLAFAVFGILLLTADKLLDACSFKHLLLFLHQDKLGLFALLRLDSLGLFKLAL
jgi:hypothetical protein